jgi:high-affinity iron transporter
LFGWQNSATYGSVISYNLYWVVVIAGFLFLGWKENKESVATVDEKGSETSSQQKDYAGKKTSEEGVMVETAVREVQ